MSYEQALQQLREAQPSPPSLTEVQRRGRWRAEQTRLDARRGLALVSTAACAAMFVAIGVRTVWLRPLANAWRYNFGTMANAWSMAIAILMPSLLLMWSARLICREGVGPQMLARAVTWSNLVVGVLIATAFIEPTDRALGVCIAFGCAMTLLACGTRGLDGADERAPFQPDRFRGLLLVALVMAFADALTLTFSGLLQLRVGMDGWSLWATVRYAGPTLLAAAVMGLAVWGLYRLRTWALVLNLLANLVVAYLALDGSLGLALPVGAALAMTAAIQSLLPYPIIALALGDRRAGQPVLGRHSGSLVFGAVTVTSMFALVGVMGKSDGWLTGPGRAFQRGFSSVHRGVADVRPRWAVIEGDHHAADFRDRDLTMHMLVDIGLVDADLREAHGGQVTLQLADLRGADLRQTHFPDAWLSGVDLRGADLRDAALERCTVRGSLRLDGADARGTSWTSCVFDGYVNLGDTDLRGADFGYVFGSVPWAAEARWEGVRCPDLTVAGPTGCVGHEGVFDIEDAEADAMYLGRYVRGDVDDWHCHVEPFPNAIASASRRSAEPGYLAFNHVRFVEQSPTRFVGREGAKDIVVEWSWPEGSPPRVRWEVQGCGVVQYRRTP